MRKDIHLVGHSIGASLALEYAAKHPGVITRLTLVSPHFVQARAPLMQRLVPFTQFYLKRATAARLALALTGDESLSKKLESSATDLRQASASNTARLLRKAASPKRRRELTDALKNYPGKAQLIIGTNDPLLKGKENSLIPTSSKQIPIHVIDGAGHHPQLTHATTVAQLINSDKT